MLAVSPFLLGATSTGASFESTILMVHNRERVIFGVNSLHWNPELAKSAQIWADHLAATGLFEHAPELPSNPQGENLWAGTKGFYRTEQRVNAWIREKRYFKPGTFPNNSTTGNVEDVGHYTQVMWRDTQEVGCAQATGAREDILVCRYTNAGNYVGEKAF
uniref:CAP domain-containing protein n=1 Tax=uncultured Sphingomonas sp. TaxID=158754 RepID=UPI0035CB1093